MAISFCASFVADCSASCGIPRRPCESSTSALVHYWRFDDNRIFSFSLLQSGVGADIFGGSIRYTFFNALNYPGAEYVYLIVTAGALLVSSIKVFRYFAGGVVVSAIAANFFQRSVCLGVVLFCLAPLTSDLCISPCRTAKKGHGIIYPHPVYGWSLAAFRFHQ